MSDNDMVAALIRWVAIFLCVVVVCITTYNIATLFVEK